MDNNSQSSGVKTKNITLKSVIAWLFGSLVGIAGIALLFSSPIVGIVALISAIIVFPPTYNFLKNRFHLSLSTGLKVVIIIILFVIGGTITAKQTPTVVPTTNSSDTSASRFQPQQTQASAPAQTPIVVTAEQLSSDYNSNQVSADAKYKGNLVDVSGTVYNVGKDFMGNPYVDLQAGEYDPLGVQCMFSQSDESMLSSISKGQEITLEGTVSGEVITDVVVDGCTIAK